MERIEDRSKALSYIGIEIAEALKYIPAPIEDFEDVKESAPVNSIIEEAKEVNKVEEVKPVVEEKPVNAVLENVVAAETTPEDTEDELYFEETRFEEKPTLWSRIKNSKLVRAVRYIMQIKVVLDYPALPEGRGN